MAADGESICIDVYYASPSTLLTVAKRFLEFFCVTLTQIVLMNLKQLVLYMDEYSTSVRWLYQKLLSELTKQNQRNIQPANDWNNS